MKPKEIFHTLLLFLTAAGTAGTAHATVRYVNVNSTAPASPYTSWSSAAVTIQDAVDAAVAGDTILVTNGVYETGGRVVPSISTTNRVAVDKPVTLASVNGAEVTVIRGQKSTGGGTGIDAVRCAYLTNGAVLIGFTLTNGATGTSDAGGGIYCQSSSATVSNCLLMGNAAYDGGGSYSGTLNNCIVANNSAFRAGGAYASTLNNCAVTRNSADNGGGAY